MNKSVLVFLSVSAVIFTIWYMHFGNLTDNSGALSKTGLIHPVYFTIWGALAFSALYSNLLYAYKKYLSKYRFQYYLAFLAGIGMLLTVTCKFDYSLKAQYFLHCAGSLAFSVLTGILVFLLCLLNYRKNLLFKILTYAIGLILSADGILLIIFKETALIEAVPVLFGLIILPAINLIYKEKVYAAR